MQKTEFVVFINEIKQNFVFGDSFMVQLQMVPEHLRGKLPKQGLQE